MKSRRKTNIPQFRWKPAEMDRLDPCVTWKGVVSTLKSGEQETGDPRRTSEGVCPRQQECRHGLPGRFPGAVPYVSFRQMECLAEGRRVQRNTARAVRCRTARAENPPCPPLSKGGEDSSLFVKGAQGCSPLLKRGVRGELLNSKAPLVENRRAPFALSDQDSASDGNDVNPSTWCFGSE